MGRGCLARAEPAGHDHLKYTADTRPGAHQHPTKSGQRAEVIEDRPWPKLT